MKKIFILIVLITLPVVTFGQNTSNDTEKKNEIMTMNSLSTEVEIQDQSTSIALTKAEVINLNYKKSYDLISIKAYRKSLQIKVKEVISC